MDQIKKKFQKSSILQAFVFYMIVFILLALALIEIEKGIIYNIQTEIVAQYANEFDAYNGDGIKLNGIFIPFSLAHSQIMKVSNIVEYLAPPVSFLFCTIMAGILFYRSKLRKPIKILDFAAIKISESDLDFRIEYEHNDEMGRLCRSFEKMRGALQENNCEMWRQMEERKRLNAAFSHDLRIPLTVLKAHSDIILKYLPDNKINKQDILDTVSIMSDNISRLENYVIVMNKLQKLEEIPMNIQGIKSSQLAASLKDTASILCTEKDLSFSNQCDCREINIDIEIVMQVFENVISNAQRFAKRQISISCKYNENILLIEVYDDGKGFSNQDLEKATYPFYKSDKHTSDTHFGLGLNICKILCERHGGGILLSNKQHGGANVQMYFKI